MIFNLIKVAFLAALPIMEIRGAIPIGLNHFDLPILPTFIFAVLGNIVPALLILVYLKPFSDFLRRWTFFDQFFSWLFKRTSRYQQRYEKYGALFLLFFVAIPLPGTGVWAGSAAAFLFGIRFSYAIFMMTAGVIIAGIIVTLTDLGILSLLT
ncbi:MAG: small multi-drug export protein [Candidatus Atribacteria bacterium]|nr:small multi-drug export protein [Candidatus Atribacteria bacterium]